MKKLYINSAVIIIFILTNQTCLSMNSMIHEIEKNKIREQKQKLRTSQAPQIVQATYPEAQATIIKNQPQAQVIQKTPKKRTLRYNS